MMQHHNPFAQHAQYHQITFPMTPEAAQMAQDTLSDMCLSVACFEVDEQKRIWQVEMLSGDAPDMEELKRRLMLICSIHKIDMPELAIGKTRAVDWLAEVAKSFPPLHVGPFYIHGSHVEESPPVGVIPLHVDAGAAFGSGEHGTTSGCLEALHLLSKRKHYHNILDMGTGSGILAIGAAYLWRVPVLAVDVDAVAVRVARENAAINHVSAFVKCAVSNGYNSNIVKKSGPYDVIIANILARPLVAFAKQASENLADDGYLILSGLLCSQERYVLHAHQQQGLQLKKRFVREGWSTLLLHKRSQKGR